MLGVVLRAESPEVGNCLWEDASKETYFDESVADVVDGDVHLDEFSCVHTC